MIQHYQLKNDTIITLLYEKRYAKDITDSDIAIASNCASNEIKLVLFKTLEPTIALGKQQLSSYVDEDRIKEDGIQVMNKATSGTVVYLDGTEFTMTVAVGSDVIDADVVTTTTVQKVIVGVLNQVLHTLGVNSEIVTTNSTHEYKPAGCFNALTKNEIEVNGKKLAGCAFTRYKNVILGHMMIHTNKSYEVLNKYINDDSNVGPIALSECHSGMITPADIANGVYAVLYGMINE